MEQATLSPDTLVQSLPTLTVIRGSSQLPENLRTPHVAISLGGMSLSNVLPALAGLLSHQLSLTIIGDLTDHKDVSQLQDLARENGYRTRIIFITKELRPGYPFQHEE